MLGLPPSVGPLRWWDIDATSAGAVGVPASVLTMVIVSLLTPRGDAERMAVVDGLRRPQRGATIADRWSGESGT